MRDYLLIFRQAQGYKCLGGNPLVHTASEACASRKAVTLWMRKTVVS
jgi:hypothetical protein